MDFTAPTFYLTDDTGTLAVDWITRNLIDVNGLLSDDWDRRVLYDTNTDSSVEWETRNLNTGSSVVQAGSFIWSADQNTNNNIGKTTSFDLYQNDLYVRTSAREKILDYIYNSDPNYSWWSGHTFEYIDHGLSLGSIVSFSGGTWSLMDTSNTSAQRLLGVVVSDNQILLDGHCILTTDADVYPSAVSCPDMTDSNMGTAIYGAQGVTGGTSITPPTATAYIVRILGHCYESSNNASDTLYLFFFRPQNSWIKV